MRHSVHIALLFFVLGVVVSIILTSPVPDPAGDIVEYYGISESLINHQGISLSQTDQTQLSDVLNPGYFDLPGYYIEGRNNLRYPVHFVFYSFLLVPIRLILQTTGLNPLASFGVLNSAIIALTLIWVFSMLKTNIERYALLYLIILSPLVFFINWPGPDILFICLILLGLVLWSNNKHVHGIIAITIASWHSQPITVLAGGLFLWHVYKEFRDKRSVRAHIPTGVLLLMIVSIPYLYNLYAFGVFTPWTLLQDAWTVERGFGLHNASLFKFFEQLFDLNFGLFWYFPVVCILGILGVYDLWRKYLDIRIITLLFILTAFFYQTNPAWHYGTAGYGPSRHALFFVPFFLFTTIMFIHYIYHNVRHRTATLIALTIIVFFSQIPVLASNNYLYPEFANSLAHSPLATHVLNTYPAIYNPTAEIFVDRTIHADPEQLTTAIYKNNDGVCTKAYVHDGDFQTIIKTCGYIPDKYSQLIRTHTLSDTYIDFLP